LFIRYYESFNQYGKINIVGDLAQTFQVSGVSVQVSGFSLSLFAPET